MSLLRELFQTEGRAKQDIWERERERQTWLVEEALVWWVDQDSGRAWGCPLAWVGEEEEPLLQGSLLPFIQDTPHANPR